VQYWWKWQMVLLPGKAAWQCLKKLNMELPYDPEILLLGVYLIELKAGMWTDIWTSMFTASLFTTAKRWKQFKCPLMDKHAWTPSLDAIIIQP
jgi:hypothetical protein